MRGAVLYAPHEPLVIEEFDLPDIAPDQVRVRLVTSGACLPCDDAFAALAAGEVARSVLTL